MRATEYRIWHPPQSPFPIEYASSLRREIGSTNGETSGVLFGLKQGSGLRVMSTRRTAGMETVGVFFARPRGEVFLTEENLRHFETVPGGVALVIAGDRAGFFVRDSAGSLQTIQSYEEFTIVPPANVRRGRSRPAWAMGVIACIAMLAIPLMAFRANAGLVVRAEHGQILLRWNHAPEGRIEIIDGTERATIVLSPELASATYVPRTSDVEVILITNTGRQSARLAGRIQ